MSFWITVGIIYFASCGLIWGVLIKTSKPEEELFPHRNERPSRSAPPEAISVHESVTENTRCMINYISALMAAESCQHPVDKRI
jgi:hypothetical protein